MGSHDYWGFPFACVAGGAPIGLSMKSAAPERDAWSKRFFWIVSPEHRLYRAWVVPRGAMAALNPRLVS